MYKMITSTIVVPRWEKGFLLIKRAHDDFNGDKWEFPGGKVDDLNDIQGEAIRELREEVLGRYDVKNFHQFSEFTVKAVGPKYIGYNLRFIIYVCDLDLPLVVTEEEERLRFGPDHQAMALLSLSCLENFVLTCETQMVIDKITKSPPI